MSLSKGDIERFDRQIRIADIGRSGQERLRKARVLMAGAGGLGSPAALYLAAAGVGKLRIVDCDRVAVSNLNRQILHGDGDVGRRKVDSARQRLGCLDGRLSVERISAPLAEDTVNAMLDGVDVIVDALDNLPARLILNKAAVKRRIPLVHGAVSGFDGRVMTVLPGQSACLRCLLPAPAPEEAAVFPVIGVTPGVIGTLQATEAIKVILGIGIPLAGRLIVYDGLEMNWTEFKVKINPDCEHCGRLQQDLKYRSG